MAKMNKMHILAGLLVFLILILLINPSVFRNMYSSILGRICLVIVVIFFAMNSVTLGLLTALIIIIASNMFMREGLDNMDTTSTSPMATTMANTTMNSPMSTEDRPIINAIQNKKDSNSATQPTPSAPTNGVDLQTIQQSLQSQSSSTLPVTPPSSTENVSPSSTEPFSSRYATV
jgi:hypothetical protein